MKTIRNYINAVIAAVLTVTVCLIMLAIVATLVGEIR